MLNGSWNDILLKTARIVEISVRLKVMAEVLIIIGLLPHTYEQEESQGCLVFLMCAPKNT